MSPSPYADPSWWVLGVVGLNALALAWVSIWGIREQRKRLQAEERLEGIREVMDRALGEEGSKR